LATFLTGLDMDSKKFAFYRKKLGLTQKEIAQLLLTSVKAIHSYEQGWRNIPENIERQIYFLISGQKTGKGNTQPCWVQRSCPPEMKKQCPAWKFKAGHLCWFITGTLCEGLVHPSWSEKIKHCRNCKIFKPVLDF
jgi:DNA-binding XRE family transcriptional regulator